MGRNRTAKQEKELRGSYQPVRDVNIPAVNGFSRLPYVPSWLNEHATKIYGTLGRTLLDAGILNELNIYLFLSFCAEYGTYIQMESEMRELEDRTDGNLLSAKYRIAQKALHNARMLGKDFGLTPSDIAKVQKPEGKSIDIEDLLK